MTKVYSRFRLLRRITRLRALKLFIADDAQIVPFQEKPAQEKAADGLPGMSASDLFSMFTADVICENKVFVR